LTSRRTALVLWLLVAGSAVAATTHARADDDASPAPVVVDDEESSADAPDPWLSGPEAPTDSDDEARRAMPPRERDAPPWDITAPPRVPVPTQPKVETTLKNAEPGPRLSTTFDRARLTSVGDLTLADALVSMPGLWMNESAAFGFDPSARGLPSEHLAITLDGIPLLPAFAFPTFPVLSHIALDDVESVTLRHGGRAGLGVEGAAGGVLDVRTLPEPRDLGEELPLTGVARGGIGGADLEKQAAVRGDVGFRRVRFGVSGAVFHREDRRQGRGDGLVSASEGFGGHLAARGDILVDKGTRVFGLWRSSRQARTPLPERCVSDDEGRRVDCLTNHDRAIDLLGAGVDVARSLGGARVDVTTRAHAQRVSEEWERTGNRLFFAEQSKDEMWRAGALASATLSLAPFSVVVDDVTPSVTLGSELLRDRVTSSSGVRSQRFGDGAASGEFLEVPGNSPLVDGDRIVGKGLIGFALAGKRTHLALTLDAGAQVLSIEGSDPRLPREIGGREVAPFFDADLGARVHLLDELALFGGLWRVDRPDTLFQRTRGRLLLSDATSAHPMLPGHGRFVEHGGELGALVSWAFVDVSGQGFIAARDGAIEVGVDATEALENGVGVTRYVRGPRRFIGGVEGTARVRPFFDGLSVESTLGAHAIDEGLFFAGAGLFSPTPAGGVVNPAGALLVRYAPPTWPVDLFTRVRYAFPLTRLSPDEESDPTLCPESFAPTPGVCRGALGYALVDVGVAFTPSEHLRIDAVGTNLLDQSHQLRTSTLPGKGIGGRLTATLSY
jgi:outer membrane receptor protein involved in Fe transport